MGPQSVFITGASRGLGLQFVKRILAEPSPPEYLFAACRDPSRADELKALGHQHGNLKIVKLDVSKDEEIRSAFDEVDKVLKDKGLNLLINNAGIYEKGDNGLLETQTRERLCSHFELNAACPVLMVKQFLPMLKTAASFNSNLPVGCSRAAVINISTIMSSISRTLVGSNFGQHYRASKAALNMLTAAMSMELKEAGILVSAIHPGWVQTDMGGPNADLDSVTSINNCWATISSLTETSTGQLINYDGKVLPW